MWIVSALFIFFLWLAHQTSTDPEIFRQHISEMRSTTPLAHLLFAFLIVAGLCFARRAREERHDLSATLGVVIAVSVLCAWVTPTYSRIHDFFASAPFVLLFLYVPVMLLHGEHALLAALTLSVPTFLDMLMWLAFRGSSGQLQKVNALIFLGLLNFVYYWVLPVTPPLLHPPYLDDPKAARQA